MPHLRQKTIAEKGISYIKIGPTTSLTPLELASIDSYITHLDEDMNLRDSMIHQRTLGKCSFDSNDESRLRNDHLATHRRYRNGTPAAPVNVPSIPSAANRFNPSSGAAMSSSEGRTGGISVHNWEESSVRLDGLIGGTGVGK